MCVGRYTCPNCVSAADRSAFTSSGNAALRNFSGSCQSTSVSTSRRRAPERRVSGCATDEAPKDRRTRTVAGRRPMPVHRQLVDVGQVA